jgi:predicted enzyme related to lactoylglutathione lyase
MAKVRYMVDDPGASAAFYVEHFGFVIELQVPAICIVSREDLTLLLSGPTSSGRRSMPDGKETEPGGWNRILLDVDDRDAEVERIRQAGIQFRNDIISGPGGRQILAEDLDGNPIELFEPE